MLSRTPSPTKSPNRLALSSKDGNVRLSSPKKSLGSTPRLSPTRPRSSLSKSPSRSPSTKSVLSSKPTPSLGFTIYNDPKDYSTELYLSSVKLQAEENDFIGNKENIEPKGSNDAKTAHLRKPLVDRDIRENPGYIEYTTLPRKHNLYQLDTLWTNSNVVQIPSYVTPPRKDRVKYLSMGSEKETVMKRSSSLNDFNSERVVKKLVFDIHKD